MTGILFCSLSMFVTNHTTPTSYIIRRNGFHLPQLDEVRELFITFEIWIFFLQKRMDSPQEAFIHLPEPCETLLFEFLNQLNHLLHEIMKIFTLKTQLLCVQKLAGARNDNL